MKTILTLIVAAAFAVTASAHCGKCEGDKKDGHKCSETCKDKCKGKEGKCADGCKDKCDKKGEEKK